MFTLKNLEEVWKNFERMSGNSEIFQRVAQKTLYDVSNKIE